MSLHSQVSSSLFASSHPADGVNIFDLPAFTAAFSAAWPEFCGMSVQT